MMKGILNKKSLHRMAVRTLCACASALAIGMGALAQDVQIPELLEPVGVKMDTVEAYISDIYDLSIHEASLTPHVEGLAFSVAGVVEEVHAVLGQAVKAGDVLVTLNQDAQSQKIQQLKREIETLQTNGSYADQLSQIDRRILELELEILMAQNPDDADAITLKKMDIEAFDLKADLERDLRQLEMTRLQEELDALDVQMGQNVLKAPFDGTVLYMDPIEKGSDINAFNPVIYLADDTQMRIETEYIMESELRRANRIYAYIGSGVYELEPIPQDERDFYSKVLAGETVTSRFKVLNPDEQVTMGAYAMVCVQSDLVEDALVIPRNALFIESSGRYVYVVEDGVRTRRDVQVDLVTDLLVEITGGLEEGEIVYVQE